MNFIKFLGSVSPYCKDNFNCPGYLVTRNNNKILLDCGFGITGQLNFPDDLQNLTIIISHYHKDHFSDLFALGYASFCYHRLGLLNKKIVLYLPKAKPGTSEYNEFMSIMNFNDHYFDIKTYNGDSLINIDDNKISFFEVEHSITSYSCKIENSEFKLVYTGDMGYKNIDEYIKFCKNADYLISESTYLESDNVQDFNHLHAKEAAQIANLSNVGLLILTHLWPEHDKKLYLCEASTIFPAVSLAEEGCILQLDGINYSRKSNM